MTICQSIQLINSSFEKHNQRLMIDQKVCFSFQKHQASSFFIVIMFSWQRQTYPIASQISNKLSRREMQDFLSYAPWSEFKKLNLFQVNLLKKNVCFMSQRKTGVRDWNCAYRDLFRRENQILGEMQRREKGVMPSTKKEESLFTIITQKVRNFFKASSSNEIYARTDDKVMDSRIERPLLSRDDK